MTYDPIDTNDDGVVDADVDNQSVDTEEGTGDTWRTKTTAVEFTTDGAYTWFNGRPVHANGKTFTGWVNSDGDIVAASYDHNSDTVTTTTLKAGFQADDHNAPGVVVQANGTLTYVYTGHNAGSIYVKHSSSAYDISSFGVETSISPSSAHTYCRPFQVSSGRIYTFYRNGNNNLAYIYYNGSSWSAETELITASGKGPYVQFDQNGDRIDIALTHAVQSADGTKEDARHAYFEGGTLYESDGTALGTSGVNLSNTTPVYDSGTNGNHDVWVWDVAYHASDDIEIVFAEFVDYDDHRYRYAHYDGTSWTHTQVTDGGSYITTGWEKERYYSGGIALDGETKGLCYLAVADGYSGELQRWFTPDNGSSWTSAKLGGGGMQNVRPMVPHNRHPDLPVLWMHGNYQYYKNGGYMTGIRGGIEGNEAAVQPNKWTFSRATLTGDLQTIDSASFTQVDFDTVEKGLRADIVGATYTNKEFGIYQIEASVGFSSITAAGEFFGSIYINGSEEVQLARLRGSSSDFPTTNGSMTVRLNEGDTVEVYAYQDSGSVQDILNDGSKTFMNITQIR